MNLVKSAHLRKNINIVSILKFDFQLKCELFTYVNNLRID